MRCLTLCAQGPNYVSGTMESQKCATGQTVVGQPASAFWVVDLGSVRVLSMIQVSPLRYSPAAGSRRISPM
jgi:hypothetical protein